MKAIQINDYGAPNVLVEVEVPTPVPGPDQVRLRIRASAVNPGDTKWRQGMHKDIFPIDMPQILGHDVAGEIDAVGDGVTSLAVGDRVLTMLPPTTQGGYAEYAVAPEADFAHIPAGLDYPMAAAIPAAGLTGWQLVNKYAKVAPNDLVLVTGATGSVGRFATFAALRAGAKVVAAVRAAHADEARALGASDVVVLGEQNWTGAPFNKIIDTVGGPDVAVLCKNLAEGGSIATASTTPIDTAGLKSMPMFAIVENDPAVLKTLAQAVAAQELPVPIAGRMPLAQAAEAHSLVERGGVGGKIILEP